MINLISHGGFKNKMKFNCDFTLQHYFEVLKSLEDEYQIGPIKNYLNKKNKKNIFLRHDVDFSLEYALSLAFEEKKNQKSSTYFVLLHSEFYNANSIKGKEMIQKIVSLGHDIGLHYDTRFFSEDPERNKQQIKQELSILEDIAGIPILTVAPHIPSETKESMLDFKDLGILNSRGVEIQTDVFYISDSGRYWRNGCMCNHLGKHDNIQILTHPIWWVENSKSIKQELDVFFKKESHRLAQDIGDYKKMVIRLLTDLNAPKKNLEI
jgi:hypothetical protein